MTRYSSRNRNDWAAMGGKPKVSEKIDSRMVKNTDGRGYSYKITPMDQFKRFLILGSMGGTYYASEKKVTMENYENIKKVLKENPQAFFNVLVDVSDGGKAVKNDPAIFALAVALNCGDPKIQRMAAGILPKVARIGTHLFQLVDFSQKLRARDSRGKWSRSLKNSLANWYAQMPDRKLAYQMLKYQRRDGWSHRDMLRLLHMTPTSDFETLLYAWSVGKAEYKGGKWFLTRGKETLEVTDTWRREEDLAQIDAFERAKTASKSEVIDLIKNHRLTREMIPTQYLKDPEVQDVMLKGMPTGALIRNLGNLSKSGYLSSQNFDVVREVVGKIDNEEALKRARMHPISILMASKVYEGGVAIRGRGTWTPVPKVVDALDRAFYKSFSAVKPINKRVLVAVDHSGSMGRAVADMNNLSAAEVGGAFAHYFLRTERDCMVLGFASRVRECKFGPNASLKQVTSEIAGKEGLLTNIGLPFQWAIENKAKFDVFLLITDGEANLGHHPSQMMKEYRRKFVSDARVVVMATTATKLSVMDPNDPLSLDIAGFSSDVPDVITGFVRGDF